MKGFPKKLYKEGEQHNGKHEQERFSPENLVEIARSAKSVEELLALAKENNFEMNEEEAKTYFAQLNPTSGELDDDDLDNVAGGGCGNDYENVNEGDRVRILIKCPYCGAENPTGTITMGGYAYQTLSVLVQVDCCGQSLRNSRTHVKGDFEPTDLRKI